LAIRADAVKAERVIGQFEMFFLRDFALAAFDDIVAEFFDSSAFDAYDVIVVLAAVQFEDRVPSLEMMAFHQPGRLELGQDPVNRGQADFLAFAEQRLVDFFRRQVPIRTAAVLQHFQDLDARKRDFESGVSYVLTFQNGNLRSVLSLSIEYDWTLGPILRNHIMPKRLTVITYCLSLFFAGCSAERLQEFLPGVYRPDIHQGNIVSQQMVDQLRPGMTKRQVAFIMGAPLLADPFHDNRWDYLYSNEPDGKPRMQKRITLVFDKDELIGLQGDFRPGNLPEIEPGKDVTIDIPKIEREKSLWEMVTGLFRKGD